MEIKPETLFDGHVLVKIDDNHTPIPVAPQGKSDMRLVGKEVEPEAMSKAAIIQMLQKVYGLLDQSSQRVNELEQKLVDQALARNAQPKLPGGKIEKRFECPLHTPGENQTLMDSREMLKALGFSFSEDQNNWFKQEEGRKARAVVGIKVVKASRGYKVYLTHKSQAMRTAIYNRLLLVANVKVQERHLYVTAK
jgi:hypothetical protein